MSIVGHTHFTTPIASDADRSQSTTTSAPTVQGHGLRVITNDADAHIASPDTTTVTGGHGHGGRRFVFPPSDTSASSPASPRPSARVTRRSSMFTTADEAREETGDGNSRGAEHGHASALFDSACDHINMPTMETEEPPSAELDGRFEQATPGQGDNEAVGEALSELPLGKA
ncbi:hypothetical protein C2E23DRAFT_856981 [Lenzites betulinus]|nr:hypothetical protein C2E23DRAFT_856981 [Lenzites betulinus]